MNWETNPPKLALKWRQKNLGVGSWGKPINQLRRESSAQMKTRTLSTLTPSKEHIPTKLSSRFISIKTHPTPSHFHL